MSKLRNIATIVLALTLGSECGHGLGWYQSRGGLSGSPSETSFFDEAISLGQSFFDEDEERVVYEEDRRQEEVQEQEEDQDPEKPARIRSVRDIQRFLGVNVDGGIGNQTIYALETLLLDLEKKNKTAFRGVSRRGIEADVYDDLNKIQNGEIDLELRNVEAVALKHFGEQVMGYEVLNGHKVIKTKKQVEEYFCMSESNQRQLEEELLAFKAIMNYEHNIAMPINRKLDQTTYIALNYARSKGLDMSKDDFSHSRLSVKANGTTYEFLIPSNVHQNGTHGDGSLFGPVKMVDPRDPIIRAIEKEVSAGRGKKNSAIRLLRFVHALEYTWDVGGGSTAKHPVRTLRDRTGDCEDATVVYLSLLRARGIRCAYIYVDDLRPKKDAHAMAGVSGDYTGTFFTATGGKKHFFAETTGNMWQIGDNSMAGIADKDLRWKVKYIP
tara:strand:- start:521 stop:1840 length:1320 start_codon:yes stop_codon:yes gene_type:complete